MGSKWIQGLLFALLMCGSVTHAAITNGGFEADLTAWVPNISGDARQMTRSSFTGYDGDVLTPVEGNFFYYADAWHGGSLSEFNDASIVQLFEAQAGDILSGYAAFSVGGPLGGDMGAVVEVSAPGSRTPVWVRLGTEVGDYAFTGWQPWSWQAPADGIYRLMATVWTNGPVIGGSAEFALDDVKLTSTPIPAPMSLGLLLVGLAGKRFYRRRLG